ncbi:GNAT family N-acetyltransferase [Pseudonocardia saturnea]
MDLLDSLAGRRVSLRHRVGERDGRPLFSDAVGELALGTDDVTVDTRRGPVRVARAAVVAVRAVPPAVPRRASWAVVARLEELCADAWPAPADERLGAWRLRAAGGWTARANGALALGDPGMPVPAALDAVRAFAAEHSVPPRVTVPTGSPWDTGVTGAGWVLDVEHAAGPESAVLVAELAGIAAGDGPWTITTPDRPDADWWALGLHGGPPTPVQRHVLDPGDGSTAFVLARDAAGTAVGQVRATVAQDHLHLSWLEVVPAARRRGLGRALVAAAAGWGRARGTRFGVLQVALHNTGARALYASTGWTEHHRYRYLVPPATRP